MPKNEGKKKIESWKVPWHSKEKWRTVNKNALDVGVFSMSSAYQFF